LTENVKHTIGLFAESGRLRHREHDPIDDVKWISTFLALGLNIDTYDPMLDIQKDENLPKIFANIEAQITKTVSQLPSISDYIGL
jgi:DNA-binding transcriptional MerR regulator